MDIRSAVDIASSAVPAASSIDPGVIMEPGASAIVDPAVVASHSDPADAAGHADKEKGAE
jgi:hypothetical protein